MVSRASQCPHCDYVLNRSLRRGDYKSCPNCSAAKGTHVYYYEAGAFGYSDARVSNNNPYGVQSHCDACFTDKDVLGERSGAIICSEADRLGPVNPFHRSSNEVGRKTSHETNTDLQDGYWTLEECRGHSAAVAEMLEEQRQKIGAERRTQEARDAEALSRIQEARGYSPRMTYGVGETFTHPVYGVGVVLSCMTTRIEVGFPEGKRVLAHSRYDLPVALAQRSL